MKPVLLLILCLTLLCPLAAAAQENGQAGAEESFFQANQAYKKGRFQAAAQGYLKLSAAGWGSGDLYYNLGNAYYRLGQLGRAVLYYERARLFIPRDPDLNFNLSQARDQTKDAIPPQSGLLEQGLFWLDSMNLYEVFLGFALVNVLFFGVLILRLFRRPEWTWYLVIVFGLCGALAAGSLAVKWHQTVHDQRAVVLQKELKVLAGPDEGDTVIFKIHEGAIVQHERSEGKWALISFGPNQRGWVKSGAVEQIRPH